MTLVIDAHGFSLLPLCLQLRYQPLCRGMIRQFHGSPASLWEVNDGGTQILMDALYTALQTSPIKAKTLRQQQVALITRRSVSGGSDTGGGTVTAVSTRIELPQQ